MKVLRGLLLKKSPMQGSGQSPEVLGFGAEPRGLPQPLVESTQKRVGRIAYNAQWGEGGSSDDDRIQSVCGLKGWF